MEKEFVNIPDSPRPIGPYSPIVQFDKLIFSSGQIALDHRTNQIVPGGIQEQTEKILENIHTLLNDSESSFDQILKMNIYLRNLDDFSIVNKIYKGHFGKQYPARSDSRSFSTPHERLDRN